MGPEVKQGRFGPTSVEFKRHFYGIFSSYTMNVSTNDTCRQWDMMAQ
jgi:hypothetical protein